MVFFSSFNRFKILKLNKKYDMRKVLKIVIVFLYATTALLSQSKKELNEIIQTRNMQLYNLNTELSEIKDKNLILINQKNEMDLKLKTLEKKIVNQKSNINELNNFKDSLIILKKILNDYLNGPKTLLQQAKQNNDEQFYDIALDNLNQLILNYPCSNEASEAKDLISNINKTKSEIQAKNDILTDERSISIKKDEFEKRTYYKDIRGDQYHINLERILDANLKLNLYFSIPFNSNTAQGLRLDIGYKDDDWLFVRKVSFLVDGKQHEVFGDFERDSGGGFIFEWIDVPANGTILALIKSLIVCSEAKVRFTGEQYTSDIFINQEQIKAIKNVYKLYKRKGGK